MGSKLEAQSWSWSWSHPQSTVEVSPRWGPDSLQGRHDTESWEHGKTQHLNTPLHHQTGLCCQILSNSVTRTYWLASIEFDRLSRLRWWLRLSNDYEGLIVTTGPVWSQLARLPDCPDWSELKTKINKIHIPRRGPVWPSYMYKLVFWEISPRLGRHVNKYLHRTAVSGDFTLSDNYAISKYSGN